MDYKKLFIQALENADIDLMKRIPKTDLHNHAARGGSIRYLEDFYHVKIEPAKKFKTLDEFNQWIQVNIKPICKGRPGYEKRFEAAFVQAKEDGVKVLDMCFGEEEYFNNDVGEMVKTLKHLHKTFAPEVNFIPGIAIWSGDDKDHLHRRLDEYLAQGYFKSIDVFGKEEEAFRVKDICRKSKDNGLIVKVHVGEFGSADLVRRVAEELEVDQIQHGIAAANSLEVMKWLSDNNIVLNVCPTSNVILSRVEDYGVHPIRKLYDNGVKVTVNTDDMNICNSGVSEEFFKLYKSGCLSAEALNSIREVGLNTIRNS